MVWPCCSWRSSRSSFKLLRLSLVLCFSVEMRDSSEVLVGIVLSFAKAGKEWKEASETTTESAGQVTAYPYRVEHDPLGDLPGIWCQTRKKHPRMIKRGANLLTPRGWKKLSSIQRPKELSSILLSAS
ncbi:hypothetical protein K402DRAFT_192917 [Aulographum hederae CBS 113979]|uniref:Secreted protein n=1 Tax=Aulographum hederae CBS 113979 TaxID=1176131 RepID=A0A6G1GNY3_9PEZI|nr:hypothetical protein K402DRAFT_192917 [Aulographum hederae CBS 113979]